MIDALLGRVTGFFEKDFLFASFLPALLLVLTISGTIMGIAGPPAWLTSMESWSASRLSLALLGAFVAVTILAYVLVSLRPALLAIWSGTSSLLRLLPGLTSWALGRQLREFRSLHAASLAEPAWSETLREFPKRALPHWSARDGASIPSEREAKAVQAIAEKAVVAKNPAAFWNAVDPFFVQLAKSGGDALGAVYEDLLAILNERAQLEVASNQGKASELDRRFGSFGTIRPTALGNVIASYQEYPFKRYGIEAEVFWPRLRAVIPQAYFEVAQEPRILLDFAVAMASILVGLAATAAVVGPWLTYWPSAWVTTTLLCLALAYFFYRVAVSAADRFGEFVRACFDLYRLDLMASLRRPAPPDTAIERAQWLELSQIAVYGVTANDVALVTPPTTPSGPGAR